MHLEDRYGTTGQSGRQTHDRLDLSYYLRAIFRRRWIALAAFSIVFLTLAVNSLKTEPVYEARTQLLIEKDRQVGSVDQLFQAQDTYFEDDFYQTQYKVLQSRTLARRTIDTLGLWTDPRFGGSPTPVRTAADRPPDGDDSLRGRLKRLLDRARAMAGIEPSPAVPARSVEVVPDETLAQSRVVDAFLAGLSITPVRNSRLVDVKYAWGDPIFAAKAANAVSNAYIEQNLELRFLSTKETAEWLAQQLEEQRRKVDASEAALQLYRENNDAIAVEDRQNIVVQRLADLNAVVTKAKTERIEKEAIYNQIVALRNDPQGFDTFPAVLSNDYIQKLKLEVSDLQGQRAQLSQKYGERHPMMLNVQAAIQNAETKLQAETGKVVDSVRNDFMAAKARETSLVQALEAQKSEALGMNRKGIQYAVLERDALSNRQIFESLLQRTKETGISGERRLSNLRIVDPAEVPRGPIFPNTERDLLVALLSGLATALALVFFFEYMDSRIRTPEEIKTQLGLPFLGMVPTIAPKELNGMPLLNNGVPAGFSEALRSVRTNILFSSAEEGAKSLVVTSTGPSEGKTLIACNLAIALAQADQRVILIDADMRRPRVHKLFDQVQEPGLSNLIVGSSQPRDVLVKHAVPNLWLMMAGHIPPNPAELLGSGRFRHLVKKLKEQFDWIVIDSPPVMAVTDASVLAHDATGVVFVVGADMTSRANASAALEQLDSTRARFVGAILNKVNLRRHGYYYSPYYRRDYASYYTSASSNN
jgi:capsular exopolysaccharide synthesis family protein